MQKSLKGFTIVELLVVITVIGILTNISAFGFGRYQASARDSQRSSKATILTEALEKYYDNNGEYPGCLAVSGAASTVTTSVLPGLNPSTLITPSAAAGVTNSIVCTDLTGAPGEADSFAYVGDGSAACSSGQSCLSFTLKYKDESSGTIKSIASRRQTKIATSGTPTLTALATDFTQINTNWTPVNNALTYNVQLATDSAFTTNVQNQAVDGSTTSLLITGLSYNTQYYFRVQANAAISQGVWSTTVPAATWTLTTPVMNATTVSSTSFNAAWNAITHDVSYTVQCSFDGVTWNSGCSNSTSALSFLFGGANQGTTYYTRVQAINGIYSSSWSNVDNTVTTINNPVAYSLSSSNTLAGGWNSLVGTSNAVCPAGTTPIYDWYYISNGFNGSNGNNVFWVSGSQYKTVSYALHWTEDVHISVATRCTTAAASSSYVWASNNAPMSLPIPTGSTWVPGDRTMHWTGVCQKWTTSFNFYWRTQGAVNASGNTTGFDPGTYYSNQGTAWGDGNARVTLTCNGPWGAYAINYNIPYGAGCVPTITVPACTQ